MSKEKSGLSNETGLSNYELEVPEIHLPARIVQASRATPSDAELYQMAQKKMRSADDFKPEDLFFFPAEISNQQLDSYFTKMAESSLRNYADDANAGVMFLNSHNNRQLGIGASLQGVYSETASDKITTADFYTVRDLKLNADLSTNDFIRGVNSGIIKDVSIGFKEGIDFAERCSICGQSYWSYDCRHIGGVEYDVPTNPNSDPTNQETMKQMAFIWIENARLSEVSAVFDGATPNAMILTKAQREQRAGRLAQTMRSHLERRYRIHLTEPKRIFAGADINDKGDKNEMADENTTTDKQRYETAQSSLNNFLTKLRSTAKSIGATVADDATETDVFASIDNRFKEVNALAEQAKTYRESEIVAALKDGARAYGKDFDDAKKRAMLERLDLAEIQEMRADWNERGDAKFGKGKNRISTDEVDKDGENEGDKDGERSEKTETTNVVNSIIPSSAFSNI